MLGFLREQSQYDNQNHIAKSLWMEPQGNSALPVDTIENTENVAKIGIVTDSPAAASATPVVDVPPIIKHETNGFSKDVAESQSFEMPLNDPADIEMTDEDEEALEIFTGQ